MKFDALGARFAHIALRDKILRLVGITSGTYLYVNEMGSRPDVTVVQSFPESRFPIPPVSNSHWTHKASDSKVIFNVTNCRLDAATGYAFTSAGEFLADFCSWSVHAAWLDRPHAPRKGRELPVGQQYLFLGTQGFYHWLIEDLPAYLQARKTDPNATTLIRQRSPRYVLDALELLGVTPVEAAPSVSVPSLRLASKGSALFANEHDVASLREFAESLPLTLTPGKRIYISRRDSSRFPDNEDEIEKLVTSKGFEIVHLARLSLLEQIQLFRSSEVVIGPHGAGLSNIVWALPGTQRVVEIANTRNPRCFEWLAEVCGLDYQRVQPETIQKDVWTADVAVIRQAIDRALVGLGN